MMRKAFVLTVLIGVVWCADAQKKKTKESTAIQLTEEDKIKVESTLAEAEKQLLEDNFGKARELFEVVLELDPTNGAANFKLAELLLKTGKNDEALAFALKAIDTDHTNKYYYLIAAEVYKSQGDFKNATKLYQEMINSIEGTDSYLFDLAILYQYMTEFELALEAYRKAEEIFGMNELVLREKQKIYLRKQDYKSLMADWDQLILENPDEPRFVVEFSEFLISVGKYEEAAARLEKITVVEPLAILLLCEIAIKTGKNERAQELAQTVLELPNMDYKLKLELVNLFLESAITTEQFEAVKKMASTLASQNPDKFEALGYAGDVMYRLEDKENARRYYLRAIKLSPSNFNVWQNILNIEAELNQYDSLVLHAEQALEYFPNQALLYYFAGTGYMIQKDYKKSVQTLESGKKYATEPALLTIFYGQLGDAYNSLKQYDKSYQSYDKALESNPKNDHVLNNYSYFLSLRKKEMEKALEMSTKLVQMHPDNPTYLDTHGWVLYVNGDYKEALKYLEKAAGLAEDGTVIEHYGDVLFQLGRVEDAVKQWERASKLSDTSEYLPKKIADRKLYE